MLYSHQSADALLLDVGVVLFEIIRKTEGDHGQASVIIRAGLVFCAVDKRLGAFEAEFAFASMDVAHAHIPAARLERLAEKAGVGHAVFHDLPEPVKAEMDEVVILGDDVSARAREVQCVGFLGAAEIVEFEDEVFG